MTLPFEPRSNDPDADHLNTLLDAMRSGTRAPDAASLDSSEAARLADAGDRFRGLVHRADAPAAAYVEAHPLHSRWEDIMSTAYPPSPGTAPAELGEVQLRAPISNRVRTLSAPASGHRINAWLSAAIVALMLLGTAGGAWWFGPGRGGPSDDGLTRLAAVTPADSTPEAIWPQPLTPDTDPWVAAISPEECTAEPMPYEEYAAALTTDPGMPDRSYEIVGPAESEDAGAVVTVLRRWIACADTGNIPRVRSNYTSEYIFFQDFTADNARYRDELDRTRAETERQWTLWAEETDLYPMSIVEGVEPPARAKEIFEFSQAVLDGEETYISPDQTPITYIEARYDPDAALMLADGRIMIPTQYVYWAEDPWLQEYGFSPEPQMRIQTAVLENVDGEWKIDETAIWICIGECDDVLDSDATPTASPVATSEVGTGMPAPIASLLSAVPARMSGFDQGPLRNWAYADIEQRFADIGLTHEAIAEDRLLPLGMNAFGPLAWTSSLFDFAADEEFVAAIGFDPYQTQQVLVAGGVPDMVTLLRGDWDTASLPAAWEAAGYMEHTTASGMTVWSLGPNGEVDPEHSIQSRMFQQLNNVAILDENTFAFTGTIETLELVIATHAGESESAIDDVDMARLLATVPDDTISLVTFNVPGSELYDLVTMVDNPNIRPEDLEKLQEPFIESRETVGPMPNYHGALFGFTSGPAGEVFVRLGAGSEEDAAQIVPVVEWRWDNFLSQRSQRPLNTIMELTDASTDGTTVILGFTPLTNHSAWLDMLNSGDLAPFAADDEAFDATTPVASPDTTPEE